MALFLTLISTAAAAVFCVALLLLVLWQDARRRSNQFFALTMFLFAAFASINFLAHINYLLHYSVETLLKTATTLYGLSTVALFVFEVYFARSPRPWRRLLQWSGAILAVILSGLLWTGAVYEQIAQLPDGTITYLLSPIGKIGLAIVSGYPLVGILALYVTNNERSRALWPITLLLPIDTFAAALPIFQAIPLNVLMMLIIALATARLMMREHVFKPMIELNQQLIKANDELSRANELKSQFLATMSHELRTPLNSVIGYTELVTSGLYGPLTDKQHDRLDKVGRNGRRLLALINDVLDLSKIEAGHMKLSRERVIVYDSLNVVFDARRPEAVAKGLQLINACPPDLPPITADPIRFEQILNNLVSNAIQFTTAGSVTLNAVPQRSDLVFSVTDTGIGIAPERRSTIFDTFLSADGESTFIGRQEGTGLGLALTRHLVQMHGGSIWFTSDGIAGKGSTFYVTLPIAASSDNAIKPRTGLLGPIVLCIDDSPEAVEVLQGLLESEGYRIYGALNGQEGLRRARELMPSLILLDIMMPGIDGWQVMEALRTDPRTARVPVLIVSSADQSMLATTLGAVGSLLKPLKRDELLMRIRAALQPEEAR